MISAKRRNEGPRVVIVTCGGTKTGTVRTYEGKQTEQWVRKSAGPIPAFDPQQENETNQRARKEVLETDSGASISMAPHEEDRAMPEKPTGKVNMLTEFLRNCVELIKDEVVLSTLYDMIDHCTRGRETPVAQKMVNQVMRRKRTNEEFRFSAQIREYDVDNIILDLGSNVNVLPKQTWELMGKPKLVWSPVQLRLANQHKIVWIGRLTRVPVHIDGVRSVVDFEVIEIVDGSQPYPALMGLQWNFANQAIINLKRREMIFEVGDLKVTTPLDPSKGKRYIEQARGNDIDNLYNMIVRMQDYVNLTANGALSWRSISLCASNFEEGLEHWQQRMHKVSTRRCVHITRSMCWIGIELCNPPRYDGLTDISMFVKTFELQVAKQQRLLALDVVLKATPARWWAAHREGMKDWLQCNKLMQIRFGTEGENIA
jgi:hypothetical protein